MIDGEPCMVFKTWKFFTTMHHIMLHLLILGSF